MADDRPGGGAPHTKDFDDRLRKARKAIEVNEKQPGSRNSAMGLAFRIAADLVAAVAVGTGIGWGLDWWLGTKPWFLLVFFLLGAAAGVMNVIRVANATADQERVANADRLPRVEDDDDD